MKMAIKSASAVFVPEKYLVQNWPVLAGRQVRSVCVPVRLYRNAAGFQRIDVTENAVLSLPDASHSKSYAGYGAAASVLQYKGAYSCPEASAGSAEDLSSNLDTDEKGCYSLPYTRTELADFLCVDRSALSRELCRMRDERILDFFRCKDSPVEPNVFVWLELTVLLNL